MGIFDAIGKIAEMAVGPIINTAVGGPVSGVASVARPPERTQTFETSRSNNTMFQQDPGLSQGYSGLSSSTSSAGSGSFFGNLGQTIGGFGRDVGGFVSDIAPALNLFGVGQGVQRTNAGAATTIINQRPDETAMSGEILGANLGLGSNLIQAATRFARTPAGGSAIGFGSGVLGAALSGGADGKVRITRRMKSDVRRIYMMAGMDPNATAQILNNLGTYPRMNFNASLVFFILTKRFRNDGPVVTKAAVRKTKTTLRRMKGVVDMYNSVCKPAARRAPARRTRTSTATTLIKN